MRRRHHTKLKRFLKYLKKEFQMSRYWHFFFIVVTILTMTTLYLLSEESQKLREELETQSSEVNP